MIDDRKLVTSKVLIAYINVDEGLRDYNPLIKIQSDNSG